MKSLFCGSHPMASQSFCPKAVICSPFHCPKVGMVSSSWEVLTPHHSSSSFTMAPWSLIALLAGPERMATIWGFRKALLPGEVVTVSPRTTLVVSKFNCLIEVVTTSTYQFSSVLSGGAIGLVSSTPDMVGEVVRVDASIKLGLCSTGQSSTWTLVEGTVATHGDSGGSSLSPWWCPVW